MSSVVIANVTKEFGRRRSVSVLKGVSLNVNKGELLVLLGPSGCGKTTLLRTIAGLEAPSGGSVSIGDQTVVDVENRVSVATHKRDVGMVFQNYALWPHMKVIDNVAYPMRARKVKTAEARQAAREVLALLHCEHLADRYPSELSGGQQQRVALGRSLVGFPRTVLFDEPLSNLDAQLRRDVRSEIHRIHNELGFTAVYVTHDLVEAVELGDRIAVMREGVIEQDGTPSEVYERPRTPYVAEFLGIENRIRCTWAGGVPSAESNVGFDGAWGSLSPGNGQYDVFIRASDIEVVPADMLRSPGVYECRITGGVLNDVLYGGGALHYVIDAGNLRLTVTGTLESGKSLTVGDLVTCCFPANTALLYPTAVDEGSQPVLVGAAGVHSEPLAVGEVS